MERVAFLLEDGSRLACLLNPATLVMRRTSGIQPRQHAAGRITGSGLTDDPLIYTGGGTTELKLHLLFDLSVAGSTIRAEDVRDLTAPFWKLSENAGGPGFGRPPVVRFLWGRSWNMRAVVAAIAERLELFSESGAARRSYLTMRLLRVPESDEPGAFRASLTSEELEALPQLTPDAGPPLENARVHTIPGGGRGSAQAGPKASSERLDVIAHEAYGDASLWRLIAYFNQIADPLANLGGRTVSLPPRSALKGSP